MIKTPFYSSSSPNMITAANTTTTPIETIIHNINDDIGELVKYICENNENSENLKHTILAFEENVNTNIGILNADNVELKEKNTILTERVNNLEIENTGLKQEIVGLKQDNVELKQENIELKHEIVGLKQENIELKREIVGLKQDNVELKHKIAVMEQKEIKNKILTSITDLNGTDLLENRLEIPFNRLLKKARQNRNGIGHYIYDDDTQDVCDRKKWFLLSKLKQFTNEEKTTLNEYFKHKEFIGRIIAYLENLRIEIKPDEEEDCDIREWWGDL